MFDRVVRAAAKFAPHSVAVVTSRGEVSFERLDADVDRVAAELKAAGLVDSGLAAVRIADPYAHILVLLALARLGCASASYGPAQGAAMLGLFAPAVLIADEKADLQQPGPLRRLHATPDWIAAVRRRPAEAVGSVKVDPNDLARVMTSSGTTGVPKTIGLSWTAVLAQQDASAIQIASIDAASRTMPLIGLETGALSVFLSTWRLMGAVLLASPMPHEIVAALGTLQPTYVLLAPIQLKLLLDVLPPDFTPMPRLRIGLVGSDTPAAVKREARLRLTSEIWTTYASTEAGMIAAAHLAQLDQSGMVGWVLPEAEVEVVDAYDARVGPGVTGRLRVRGASAVTRYLDDEEASARAFRDGWFYPGDIGSLSPDGMLRVDGRTDEVMNFGGEKFLPRVLEDPVLACAGVRDAAAFSMADASGQQTPWIAVVRGEGLDPAVLGRALAIPSLPPVHIAWIEEIPRNALGKVQRDRLQAAAKSLADKPKAGALH